MKKRTILQKKAYKRNFTIMSLLGMYMRLEQIKKDQPKIKLYCGDIQFLIDDCLDRLEAVTQTDRLGRR